MKINSNNLLLYFLLVLAGSGIGFLVGGYTGTEFGISIISNGTLNKDAADVETHISVLRQLRQQENADAIEQIEAYIDDALIIFDPNEPYPGLKQGTIERISAAIKTAHNYRTEFPRQSSRSHVDEMIKNLFQKHNLE